jgi:hypothetical protein
MSAGTGTIDKKPWQKHLRAAALSGMIVTKDEDKKQKDSRNSFLYIHKHGNDTLCMDQKGILSLKQNMCILCPDPTISANENVWSGDTTMKASFLSELRLDGPPVGTYNVEDVIGQILTANCSTLPERIGTGFDVRYGQKSILACVAQVSYQKLSVLKTTKPTGTGFLPFLFAKISTSSFRCCLHHF